MLDSAPSVTSSDRNSGSIALYDPEGEAIAMCFLASVMLKGQETTSHPEVKTYCERVYKKCAVIACAILLCMVYSHQPITNIVQAA